MLLDSGLAAEWDIEYDRYKYFYFIIVFYIKQDLMGQSMLSFVTVDTILFLLLFKVMGSVIFICHMFDVKHQKGMK